MEHKFIYNINNKIAFQYSDEEFLNKNHHNIVRYIDDVLICDYHNFLDKIIFTKEDLYNEFTKSSSGGQYNAETKTITIPLVMDDINLNISIVHELFHVRFTVNNKDLYSQLKNNQKIGLFFLNEFITVINTYLYLIKKDADYFGEIILKKINISIESMSTIFTRYDFYEKQFEKLDYTEEQKLELIREFEKNLEEYNNFYLLSIWLASLYVYQELDKNNNCPNFALPLYEYLVYNLNNKITTDTCDCVFNYLKDMRYV